MIRFGLGESSSEAEAKTILAPYPAGASVDVRYDPQAPVIAAIETSEQAAKGRIIGGYIALSLPFVMVALMYLFVRFLA